MFFWNSLVFSMIQRVLEIWSMVPLPFLNPAWIHWKFLAHELLKPSLEDFQHYLASVWNECNCVVVWTFFGIAFLWDWNENTFHSCGHRWMYQIWWHIECSTLTASSFRIWNSSAGIPAPLLDLFIVMLPKATWLNTPGCQVQGEWSHHHGYLGH